MLNRIKENEGRLDNILAIIKELEIYLDKYNNIEKDIIKINKYYGSKDWFNDLKYFENNKTKSIKAGVLSEDAIWNMNEDIKELKNKMKKIINNSYYIN